MGVDPGATTRRRSPPPRLDPALRVRPSRRPQPHHGRRLQDRPRRAANHMSAPTGHANEMTRPAVTALVAIGMAMTGCVHGHSAQPTATPGATATTGKNVSTPAGQEFSYRGVHLVVPADWPIHNEHTGCPPYHETGLYVVEPLRPDEGTPQCMSSPPPADGVRIGPLVGYPPTP